MSKLDDIKEQSPEDMLAAGWVLLEYNLQLLLWVGRDQDGNRYDIGKIAFAEGLRFDSVNIHGNSCRRCKPQDLVKFGACVIPRRNISGNR